MFRSVRRIRRAGWLFTALLLFGGSAAVRAEAPVRVVATFSILADLTRQVGGPGVDVVTLVGPDDDAHVFQPTPRDAAEVARARLVVMNGLGFEGWMQRLITASETQARIVTVTDGLPRPLMRGENDAAHGGGHHSHAHTDGIDPHAWQDLGNGRLYVQKIAAGLVAVDPDHAAAYRANAARLDAELATLDRWVRQEIAGIPADRRVVMTAHGAFGYFARAYGVTFLAPQGLSTEDEPSARELETLIDRIRADRISALFPESRTGAGVLRQLAEETGVVIGPRLYADALSPAGGPADSYQRMFRYNVTALVAAMRGGR